MKNINTSVRMSLHSTFDRNTKVETSLSCQKINSQHVSFSDPMRQLASVVYVLCFQLPKPNLLVETPWQRSIQHLHEGVQLRTIIESVNVDRYVDALW